MAQDLDQSHNTELFRLTQRPATRLAHTRPGNTLELRLRMTAANRLDQRRTQAITGQLAGDQPYA
jgi:hypothetical protein